jgi:excisionase family DNA binding protein
MTTTTTTPARHLSTGQAMLTPGQVALEMGVSVRTLWRMIERGDFPQPVRYNRKLVRFPAAVVEAYLDGLCGEPSLPC